jgi:hypothetical protein
MNIQGAVARTLIVPAAKLVSSTNAWLKQPAETTLASTGWARIARIVQMIAVVSMEKFARPTCPNQTCLAVLRQAGLLKRKDLCLNTFGARAASRRGIAVMTVTAVLAKDARIMFVKQPQNAATAFARKKKMKIV